MCCRWMLGVLLLFGSRSVLAQPGEANGEVAAARVNGVVIPASDVDRALARQKTLASLAASNPEIRRRVLQRLIDRELVLQWLTKKGWAATEADVERAVQQLKARVARQRTDWEKYLAERGESEESLRRLLLWKLSWERYLKRFLTEDNLAKYFERHQREFDGTQLRVAQLLLKLEADAAPQQIAARRREAESIRARIVAGELSFSEAARKYSEAPSAVDGGDLGWIERHQPMPEVFSAAAFALEPGEVSPPIVSSFGVHLIYCQEVRPGGQTWRDVQDALQAAVTEYLFRWVADQARSTAQIEVLE